MSCVLRRYIETVVKLPCALIACTPIRFVDFTRALSFSSWSVFSVTDANVIELPIRPITKSCGTIGSLGSNITRG